MTRETGQMNVLVWITEDGWEACVQAARTLAPAGADLTLLHVTDTAALEAAHGAFTALLGRSRADPGAQLEALAESSAEQILAAAAAALDRPAGQIRLRGRPEHQVALAARDASLLILAREGGAAGPKSLGKAARFVVDHATCPVLLVWPGLAPDTPLPPPPAHEQDRPHGKRHRDRHGPPSAPNAPPAPGPPPTPGSPPTPGPPPAPGSPPPPGQRLE